MKKMNNLLAAMIPLALAANDFGHIGDRSNNLKPSDIIIKPKEKPIPNGCKVYYFDEAGNCLYDVKHESAVFRCIAINKKSAIRKFNKWISSQMKKSVV